MKQYDLVAICAQECPRKFKTTRAAEIEEFMRDEGFATISSELVDMWEMFIIVFVKINLYDQIGSVNTTKLAKGAMRQMIGNKGCIAYNFTFRDRHINIFAVHLRHGQNASAERD